MAKILIVEDDHDVLLGLAFRVRASGHEVVTASDAVQATMSARKDHPDVILLDIGLPGGNGIDLITKLRPLAPTAAVIMVTAHDPATMAEKAYAKGAAAFLQKPVESRELLSAIDAALGADPSDQTAIG